MNNQIDIKGKTISNVVAAQDTDDGPARIWMLQFTDGTHVEFVSPAGQRHLKMAAGVRRRRGGSVVSTAQLALNVA